MLCPRSEDPLVFIRIDGTSHIANVVTGSTDVDAGSVDVSGSTNEGSSYTLVVDCG